MTQQSTDDVGRQGPATLSLFLLGGFRAERAGQTIADSAWQRRSAKGIVKMLAVAEGHQLHSETLMDRLWPDADFRAARGSLHQALKAARRALDLGNAPSHIDFVNGMVRLAHGRTWVDVDRFSDLARQALNVPDVESLIAAADAYGGELLPEDRYEEWIGRRREELAELYVRVLVALANQLDRRGAYGAAVERVQQALAVEPSDEDLHRLLMRLYADSGRRHQALRQYHLCRQAVLAELDTEPDEETEALYRDILGGRAGMPVHEEPAPFPPMPAILRRFSDLPYAGRERSLGILLEKLSRLPDGEGGVVFISGEAGVGKTRLAVELAREAGKQGALMLWGSSYAEEGQLPYGPFVEALEAYLDALPQGERQRILAEYPELGHLLTASGVETTPQQMERTRMQLFAAISRLLSELDREQPVILMLDDLHTADEASVQLLHYLARSAQRARWLILGAYREDEVAPGSPLQNVVTACMRRGFADHIELLCLSRPEADTIARSLLGGEIGGTVLTALFDLSLGNPLFHSELIAALRESGVIARVDGQWQAAREIAHIVPPSVSELITARASRLHTEAASIANLAAVAGMEVPFTLLHDAAGLEDGALLDGLDEILAARIMEDRVGVHGKPDHVYAFRHPLFREALYTRLIGPRRALLHTRVAETIERITPADVETLAFHWSRTSNDDRALTNLELAGDRAVSRYANDLAERYYRDVLERLQGMDREGAAVRVSEKLSIALIALSRYDDAVERLEGTVEAYERLGSLEDVARCVAALGRAHQERGTADEGRARVLATLDRVAPQSTLLVSPENAARLYLSLAHLSLTAGRYADLLAAAERAVEYASAAGNDKLIGEAEGRRGVGLLMLGRHDESLAVLERANALAEAAGDLVTLSTGLNNAAQALTGRGEMSEALDCLRRSLEVAERTGIPSRIGRAHSNLAGHLDVLGRLDEAWEHFQQAYAIFETIGASWYMTYTLGGLGFHALVRGDLDDSKQYYERSVALAEQTGDRNAICRRSAELAWCLTERGEAEAARDMLECLVAEAGVADPVSYSSQVQLCAAYLALGRLESAASLSRELEPSIRAAGVVLLLVDWLRVHGSVLAAEGRLDEAYETLLECAETARSASLGLHEARALIELGGVYRRRDETVAARSCYERALALVRGMNARYYVDRIESLMLSRV